jgi:polar amino acid transport system substrate-binding protein
VTPRGLAAALAIFVVVQSSASLGAQSSAPLRWGGDAAGGAPFVEADARDPNKHVGLDVEIAELIARELGRPPEFIQVPFHSLDQSAVRGDFDIGLSGIEDTPARRALLPTSIPYYEFREVLTVREHDRDTFLSLADLRGKNVATLTGTIAYEILNHTPGIVPKWYDDDVAPYSDLAAGRVDAVLLDNVLADRSTHQVPGLYVNPTAIATSHYVIIVSPADPGLRDRVDRTLRAAMKDGRLQAILTRWHVWNADQPPMFARLSAQTVAPPGDAGAPGGAASPTEIVAAATPDRWAMTRAELPLLFKAAWRTLYLSCVSMALAVGLGMAIAIGRVYGPSVVRGALLTYVEVMRGTPILLQLFIIYYGLPVKLDAYVAALLGLGLNYAAYESEIYRGALEAIPVAQLEAARVLGFTEWQSLRLIRAPQALRLALAPMTNDFVAMLKDSSLVSVIAVTELEQQTQIFATDMRSWVIPGLLCAGLYLAMSLPIAQLARRLDARWKASTS